MKGEVFQSFGVLESQGGIFEPSKLEDVLDSKSPIYVVRSAVPADVCNIVTAKFDAITNRDGSDRSDSIPAIQMGPELMGKSVEQYTNQTRARTKALLQLLEGVDSDNRDLLTTNWLRQYLENTGRSVDTMVEAKNDPLFIARKWQDKGQYSLSPHTDIEPYTHMDDDRLQQIKTVFGVNTCVFKEAEEDGTISVWNLCPSEEEKQSIDEQFAQQTRKTGYSYPQEYVEGLESLSVQMSPGDIAVVQANAIHAVSRGNRMVIGGFYAKSESGYVQFT